MQGHLAQYDIRRLKTSCSSVTMVTVKLVVKTSSSCKQPSRMLYLNFSRIYRVYACSARDKAIDAMVTERMRTTEDVIDDRL